MNQGLIIRIKKMNHIIICAF